MSGSSSVQRARPVNDLDASTVKKYLNRDDRSDYMIDALRQDLTRLYEGKWWNDTLISLHFRYI